VSALVERPQGQAEVREQGAVEGQGAGRIAPEAEEPDPARLHRVEGDQAQRVAQEVAAQVGDEDEAGDGPGLADPAAAERAACRRAAAGGSGADPRRSTGRSGVDRLTAFR
jgi:hypothetical protein